MQQRRHWKIVVFWSVIALLAWRIVGTSQVFQSCIHEHKNDTAYHALHESGSILLRTYKRVSLNGSCVGAFTNENQGSLTVLATFIVALFTFTLWRSTDKLWNVSDRQASIAESALTELERPYIIIWGIDANERTGLTVPSAVFFYSVSNKGKLSAIITQVQIACGYKRIGMFPPLVTIGDHRFYGEPIVSSDQEFIRLSHYEPWQTLDNGNVNMTFSDGLIFKIVISYRGMFTKGHETSQSWRFVKSLNGWAEIDDPRHTYIR